MWCRPRCRFARRRPRWSSTWRGSAGPAAARPCPTVPAPRPRSRARTSRCGRPRPARPRCGNPVPRGVRPVRRHPGSRTRRVLCVTGACGDVQHALGVGDPLRALADSARRSARSSSPSNSAASSSSGTSAVLQPPGSRSSAARSAAVRAGAAAASRAGSANSSSSSRLRREGGPQVIEPGPHSRVRPQLAPQGREVHLLVLGAVRDHVVSLPGPPRSPRWPRRARR